MPVNKKNRKIAEALSVLVDLGMPRAQQNERSALALLALLDLQPGKAWSKAQDPFMGITPIMDWARKHYNKRYAPNTRETVRRQTMHQFVQAGIALYNPDQPDRPVNSPHAVYRIEPGCLKVLRTFGTNRYKKILAGYLASRETLAAQYAKHREMKMVPLRIVKGQQVRLSPGEHSELIRAVWEEFGPRFVPGGQLVYAGDTGDKWGYFDEKLMASLGVTVDNHGKMPDVVVYYPDRKWLILAEAVTTHGQSTPSATRNCKRCFGNARPDWCLYRRFQIERLSRSTSKRFRGRRKSGSPTIRAT
jgi:hypothetical protein